jgi:hypothetical protein
MIDTPAELVEDDNVAQAVVSTEVVIPGGRVDLQIESPSLLTFIEVKVDADEGPSQLQRYRVALEARGGQRAKVLALLTMPGADGPPPGLPCIHVNFVDLLACWLPFARALGDDAQGYLARYLSSVARLLAFGGQGPFEQWTFAAQRSALDFVSQLASGVSRAGDF